MNSTTPIKSIHGTTGYLNQSWRIQGAHPDVHTSLRSKTVRRIHEGTPSSPGEMVTNVKSRKPAPGPANTSPVNRQGAAQDYSARATGSINHAKFMELLEGWQSTPIENAESSKQGGWSRAGNNEERHLVKRTPPPKA